jgi:hypothetical protein
MEVVEVANNNAQELQNERWQLAQRKAATQLAHSWQVSKSSRPLYVFERSLSVS